LNDDTARAIIIGLGLISCILLMVVIAQRMKHRQDKGLPAFQPARAKTEVKQSM